MLGERERAVVLAVLAGVVAMVAVWGRAPQADSDTTGALRVASSPRAQRTDSARAPAAPEQDGSGTRDRGVGGQDGSPDAGRAAPDTAPAASGTAAPAPSASASPPERAVSPDAVPTRAPARTDRIDPPADLLGDCPEAVEGLQSSAPGSAPAIALTFDDGPGPYTARILDVLAEKEVPATFFVTGQHAHEYPELVARATREGHLVGNHTWDHEYPQDVEGGWTVRYLKDQLTRTSNAVVEAGGERTCWLRPPGGSVPANLQPVARALRMSIALWSVDTEDWKVQSGGDAPGLSWKIFLSSITTDQQHPIVLLHDGGGFRGATAAALPRIIDWYRERGYAFVRLDGRS